MNPNIHQELSIKRNLQGFIIEHATKQGIDGAVAVFFSATHEKVKRVRTAIVDRHGHLDEVKSIRYYDRERYV